MDKNLLVDNLDKGSMSGEYVIMHFQCPAFEQLRAGSHSNLGYYIVVKVLGWLRWVNNGHSVVDTANFIANFDSNALHTHSGLSHHFIQVLSVLTTA